MPFQKLVYRMDGCETKKNPYTGIILGAARKAYGEYQHFGMRRTPSSQTSIIQEALEWSRRPSHVEVKTSRRIRLWEQPFVF
jgi:hypothetical protein